jgi:hypothetical protein
VNLKIIATSLCVLTFVLAAVPGSEPVYAASAMACDAFARDYARHASRQGQVVRHGLFGGLLGAGNGAAAGGAGAGAAIGGGVGLLSGKHARQRQADKMYHAAFRDCMVGRVR